MVKAIQPLFLTSVAVFALVLEPAWAHYRIPIEPPPRKSATKIQSRFLISEQCSLQRFIETLAGDPHSTTWVKDWYFQQRGSASDQDKEICQKYKTVMDKYHQADNFKDITGRRMNLVQKISCLAGQSSDLDALLTAIKPLVKHDDFLAIEDTYRYFAPLYHRLVWEPRLPKLQNQLADFRTGAEESKMNEKLAAVKYFMKSDWDDRVSFDVFLLPLPESDQRQTHGESIGKTQFVEVRADHKFKDQADVVFHEDCHALWSRQREHEKLRRAYINEDCVTAYSELDEGMATALGQGWFCRQSFGEVAKEWYNDEVISAYAHGLYPILLEYITEHRVIDDDFVKRSIAVFHKQLPQCMRAINRTSSILVITDKLQKDHLELEKVLSKAMPRLRSFSVESIGSYSSLDPDKADRIIVMMPPDKISRLTRCGLSKQQVALLARQGQTTTTVRLKHSDLTFCVAEKYDTQKEQLFELLKHSDWPIASDTE